MLIVIPSITKIYKGKSQNVIYKFKWNTIFKKVQIAQKRAGNGTQNTGSGFGFQLRGRHGAALFSPPTSGSI